MGLWSLANLCVSLAIIPKELLPSIQVLSEMRNKFAHQYDFDHETEDAMRDAKKFYEATHGTGMWTFRNDEPDFLDQVNIAFTLLLAQLESCAMTVKLTAYRETIADAGRMIEPPSSE